MGFWKSVGSVAGGAFNIAQEVWVGFSEQMQHMNAEIEAEMERIANKSAHELLSMLQNERAKGMRLNKIRVMAIRKILIKERGYADEDIQNALK